MKDIILTIIALVPRILCVIGAYLLARHGIDGWGWFLFIAVGFGININCKGKNQ